MFLRDPSSTTRRWILLYTIREFDNDKKKSSSRINQWTKIKSRFVVEKHLCNDLVPSKTTVDHAKGLYT